MARRPLPLTAYGFGAIARPAGKSHQIREGGLPGEGGREGGEVGFGVVVVRGSAQDADRVVGRDVAGVCGFGDCGDYDVVATQFTDLLPGVGAGAAEDDDR